MPHYRIYWIGTDNHIHRAEAMECETDEQAWEAAKDRFGAFPSMELWRGATLVRSMTPPPIGKDEFQYCRKHKADVRS